MIHSDTYQFLMREASSKEFDVIMNLITDSDWNNYVRVDVYDLSRKSNTTMRYTREILKKLISNKRRRAVLSEVSYGLYRLHLGKSSILYNTGDNYGKMFSFFYSSSFQNLSIYSKRIILNASLTMSRTNQTEIHINSEEFLGSTDYSFTLIPSRNTLYHIVQETNDRLGGDIELKIATSIITKKEVVIVKFNPALLDNVVFKKSERTNLKRTLFNNGFFGLLSDNHYIELEKVGKYIFNSLYQIAKKGEATPGSIDSSLSLARELYDKSIARLTSRINYNEFETKDPKELSAYFSSVAFSVATEILAIHKQKFETFEILLGDNHVSSIEYSNTLFVNNLLSTWCESWLMSRVNKKTPDRKVDRDREANTLTKLKDFLSNSIEDVRSKISRFGNKIRTLDNNLSYWNSFEDDILNFIDIRLERLTRPFSESF